MPENEDPFAAPVRITRPLSGVTLLLVEDSRLCSEAVRLMALRSGARLRRADSLLSARRHLRTYCPDAILVDVGLPDGCGLDLVSGIAAQGGDRPLLIATSGGDDDGIAARCRAAGADAFLQKPVRDLAGFTDLLGRLLGRDGARNGARNGAKDGTRNGAADGTKDGTAAAPAVDRQAFMDDIDRISGILEQALPKGDQGQMLYCARFLRSVALSADDRDLAVTARRFFSRMEAGETAQRSGEQVLEALRIRLAGQQAFPVRAGSAG